MDSSKELDIKKINQDIIEGFQKKGALEKMSAIYIEDLKLSYPLKLQYYLVEEFVRNDFIKVIGNGKIYFNQKKYNFEKKKVQAIYIAILLIPLIVGGLLLVL